MRRTVTVTAEIRRHRRPVLGALGLVFGALCLYYGGLAWVVAFGLAMTWSIWKYR